MWWEVRSGGKRPLKARVLCDAKSDSVLLPEFLQFCHDAVRDIDGALCKKAVHGRLDGVELVLNGEIDKVGVQDDVVRRAKLG